MDELVLALFQGPEFNLTAPLIFVLALLMGGLAIRAAATGRIGSGEKLILREEQPRQFRRSVLATAALAILFLAGAAYALVRPVEFRTGIHLAMPLLWLLLLAQSLYLGVAFAWSRAEQPRLFWFGLAMIVFFLAISLESVLTGNTI